MPYQTFFKLVGKALRFALIRPVQRYNVYNRAKKYLGPDGKKFLPAPRAIGSLSKTGPLQYPHLQNGFISLEERRRLAIEKPVVEHSELSTPKSFSVVETDDSLVIDTASKLNINKIIDTIAPPTQHLRLTDNANGEVKDTKTKRPLPENRHLDRSDLASYWATDKVPPGRLNIRMLQEIMLNKLGNEELWTSKMLADTYQIKEEYVDEITRHMKPIKLIVSPMMAKSLDLTAKYNEEYQASKHLLIHVDKRMRTKLDKSHDAMYLETDDLPEEILNVIDRPGISNNQDEILQDSLQKIDQRPVIRPAPLRIRDLNRKPEQERLESAASSSKPRDAPDNITR